MQDIDITYTVPSLLRFPVRGSWLGSTTVKDRKRVGRPGRTDEELNRLAGEVADERAAGKSWKGAHWVVANRNGFDSTGALIQALARHKKKSA